MFFLAKLFAPGGSFFCGLVGGFFFCLLTCQRFGFLFGESLGFFFGQRFCFADQARDVAVTRRLARLAQQAPGVFAGGDLVLGPDLVVRAVRDSRKAAAGINRYLSDR